MKTIQLTDLELRVIENALNTFWNEAHNALTQGGIIGIYSNNVRPLGDIEKALFLQQKELSNSLLRKIESL